MGHGRDKREADKADEYVLGAEEEPALAWRDTDITSHG
jgi:hypothetical protein